MEKKLEFNVEDLPLDVFELAESGLEVESLTAGHGIPENGASVGCNGYNQASCTSCYGCGCSTPSCNTCGCGDNWYFGEDD